MLHIHNGDSTAGMARKAEISGDHIAWREALVCGPAPGRLAAEEFRRVRARYLSEAYGVDVDECETQLREQHEALARFAEHDEVVLWFEHDLFCQVHLIYLLNWFAQRELDKTQLSLICIDKFPGSEDFRGLGQLDETQLASLFPTRREVSTEQMHLGSLAWRAYSSADPADVKSLLASDTSALPCLREALFKHLERFPSVRNGLGRVEKTTLKLIANDLKEFKDVFPAFGKAEPTYGFGDAQIFAELKRLATAQHPLLTMSNGHDADVMDSPQLPATSFQLTEEGAAVLNGDEDFVRLNGIDLWLGGVRLEGNEAAWRWDEAEKNLVSERAA
jgi:hypothetical protein